jgi:hypothetical protein
MQWLKRTRRESIGVIFALVLYVQRPIAPQKRVDRVEVGRRAPSSTDSFSEVGEQVITDQELADIRTAVDDLSEQILASSLDQTLRTLLLDQLEALRRSIGEYRIRGAKGLEKTVEEIIGTVMRNAQKIRSASDRGVVERFVALVDRFDRLASVALKVQQLVEFVGGVGKLLGP